MLLRVGVGGSVWPLGTVTSDPRPPRGPMVVYSPERGAGVPGVRLVGLLIVLFSLLVSFKCGSRGPLPAPDKKIAGIRKLHRQPVAGRCRIRS